MGNASGIINVKEKIENILLENFGSKFEVVDESHNHAGHTGNPDGKGQTHFRITAPSHSIPGNTRLTKHRTILTSLGELTKTIHSIEINLI